MHRTGRQPVNRIANSKELSLHATTGKVLKHEHAWFGRHNTTPWSPLMLLATHLLTGSSWKAGRPVLLHWTTVGIDVLLADTTMGLKTRDENLWSQLTRSWSA